MVTKYPDGHTNQKIGSISVFFFTVNHENDKVITESNSFYFFDIINLYARY